MPKFSERLNKKLKKYLYEKYGVLISDEEANDYLSSLADLCVLLTKG